MTRTQFRLLAPGDQVKQSGFREGRVLRVVHKFWVSGGIGVELRYNGEYYAEARERSEHWGLLELVEEVDGEAAV